MIALVAHLRTIFATAFCLAAMPAFAEVCDKENPSWSHADGPVGQIGETIRIVSSPFGLVMLTLLVAALSVPGRWLSAVLAALFAALAGLILSTAWDFDAVAAAAYREGCRAEPWLASGLFALLMLALSARILRRMRKR